MGILRAYVFGQSWLIMPTRAVRVTSVPLEMLAEKVAVGVSGVVWQAKIA